MTISLRLALAFLLTCFSVQSFAVPVSKKEPPAVVKGAPAVKVEKTSVVVGKEIIVTMENKLIDGKKVWVPSITEIPLGANVKIEIQNKLVEPHGFELVGHGKPVVIMPNTKASISFKADKVGPVEFKCHMHPAHVGGKFQVK